MSTSNTQGSGNATDGTQEQLLFEIRKKIYPRAVGGIFARWRWAMVWFTQLIFYGLPWLNWNDRQAVLFDLTTRKFHIFGLVLYPQDFIYLTGLLMISAFSLFLFTAVAGRLWCGYTCPQTVYTEIFLWVERMVEGDRSKRIRLDAQPMSGRKFQLKATKHGLWLLIALWTGISFVGYFTPIRELVAGIFTGSLSFWQYFWVLFYGFATYGNAGFMREQVCKYMCPYARFQGVMCDSDTLVITYDEKRGDPRGSRSKKVKPDEVGLGDCIDCGLCVQVCPTGIDIRDGQQYECIGCAACIDACNQVMDKMQYPRGLVRYDTLNSVEMNLSRAETIKRTFRPRILVYSAILLGLFGVWTYSLASRTDFKVNVIRDRGTLAREVKNGLIENVYKLQVINTAEQSRQFTISPAGLPDIHVDGEDTIDMPAATTQLFPLRLRVDPEGQAAGSHKIELTITEVGNADIQRVEGASFYLPEPY